ncbi:MAG: anti-sigma factor [Rhodospirillaceae bacterium]
MSETRVPIGEDDLQAFIDGCLPGPRRAEVEAYLAAQPEVAARVAEDRRLRKALRTQLQPLFDEPVPARLRISGLQAARRSRGLARLRAAAAALAIFCAGAGGGWLAHGTAAAPGTAAPRPMAIAHDATMAYRTFVVEVAHPVEVRAAQQDHLMHWLSKRLGRRLAAPDLSSQGYRLMGGRLLPAGNVAAAQLMYDDAAGNRLTLYVQASHGTETAFRFAQMGEDATFAWIDRGFGFAVTARATRDALLPVAEAVYRQFEATGT